MKKIIVALFAVFLICSNVFAATQIYNSKIKSAIRLYKQKNYTGCLQNMQDVLEDDPSNVLAHYYAAISYVKIGRSDDAKTEYNKVIELNTSSKLTTYAQIGIDCIDNPEECPANNGITAVEEVQNIIQQKQLESLKDIVNSTKNIQSVPSHYYKNFKDYSKPPKQYNSFPERKKSEAPTGEEVVAALNTLQKAGYNPLNGVNNPMMNPEQSQVAMMMSAFGNGNTKNQNSFNNMLPYMFLQQSQQNGEKVDPKVIQSMIMNSMMGDMYSTFGTSDKDNNY